MLKPLPLSRKKQAENEMSLSLVHLEKNNNRNKSQYMHENWHAILHNANLQRSKKYYTGMHKGLAS